MKRYLEDNFQNRQGRPFYDQYNAKKNQCQERLVNKAKLLSDLLSPLKQKRDIFSDSLRFKRSTGS